MTVDPLGFGAFIVGIGVAVFLLWRHREQVRSDNRESLQHWEAKFEAAQKLCDEKILSLQTASDKKHETLMRDLRDANEKANTMGYEIAELREVIGYERGIFDKDYAEARRKKRIEQLDKEAEEEVEPPYKKRGRNAAA